MLFVKVRVPDTQPVDASSDMVLLLSSLSTGNW